MKRFNQLTNTERAILAKAWEWLSDNEYPYSVEDTSTYLFRYDEEPRAVAVAEIRTYERILWVQVLFVHEHYRNIGLGTELLKDCIDLAAFNGRKCGLATHQDNNAMQRLATKMGFSSPVINFELEPTPCEP